MIESFDVIIFVTAIIILDDYFNKSGIGLIYTYSDSGAKMLYSYSMDEACDV